MPDPGQPVAGIAPAPVTAAALGAWWEAMRGERPLAELEALLVPHPHLGARLACYESGFLLRQESALRSIFPATASRLGGRFRERARAYALAHPSEDPALERLGRFFPQFLDDPVDAGVARLEWARNEALLAPEPGPGEGPPADPEAFARSRLSLAPSLRIAEAAPEVLAQWRPPAEGAAVVFCRPRHAVHERAIHSDELAALRAARAGAEIHQICAAFAGAADPIARAREALGVWWRSGWAVGFVRPSPEVSP